MKIKALDTFAIPFEGFVKGRVYELEEARAIEFIAQGLAESIEIEPEDKPAAKKKSKAVKNEDNDNPSK